MLIKCEFCGVVYDTNDYMNCPNCHAASGKNSTVQQQIENQNRANQFSTYSQIERDRYATDRERYNADAERFNAEQEYLETQRLKDRIKREKTNEAISKGIRLGCSLPFIIIGLLIACGIIFGVYNALKDEGFLGGTYKPDTSVEETIVEEIVETPQNVSINEVAKLTKYSVVCDRFQIVDPYPWNIDEGKEMYEVHLVIENLSGEDYKFGDKIICVADGFQCDMEMTPRSVETALKSKTIATGLKIQGSICFSIPTDAKEVTLKCGDYITIKLK